MHLSYRLRPHQWLTNSLWPWGFAFIVNFDGYLKHKKDHKCILSNSNHEFTFKSVTSNIPDLLSIFCDSSQISWGFAFVMNGFVHLLNSGLQSKSIYLFILQILI